jgi:hypothetical protein
MSAADKYRVQSRVENPEAVRLHTGKTHKWVDVSAHRTLSAAKQARSADQRVIQICTPSQGALLVDTGAYRGRRFNVVVSADTIEVAA